MIKNLSQGHRQSKSAFFYLFSFLVNNSFQKEIKGFNQSAIVFSPHPDDETLGCGGTIIKKKQNGANISVVFMTDGRRSHRHLIAEEQLRLIRKQEALNAGHILSLKEEDLIFLDFKNGQLHANSKLATTKVADILINRKPDEIFIPYYKEPSSWGSGDHTATHKVVTSALKIYGKTLIVNEYPIAFWQNWPWIKPPMNTKLQKLQTWKNGFFENLRMLKDFRYYVDVKEVLENKRVALELYKSQTTRLLPDVRWRTLSDISNGDFLDCFFRKREIFKRYTQKN